MTTHRPSAKIYAFPARGRATRALPVEQTSAAVVVSLASARAARTEHVSVTRAECGSWYHEAAVREAEPARKR